MGILGNRGRKRSEEPEAIKDVDDLTTLIFTQNLYTDFEVDIEAVVKLKSINLIKDNELNPSISGLLQKDSKTNKWTITVNNNHHIKRQRFTIAHEFAHFCLHKGTDDHFIDQEIFFRKDHDDPIEFAADKFAAQILMPEKFIKQAIDSDGIKNIETLSNLFNVSNIAIKKRVLDLGYKFKNNEE